MDQNLVTIEIEVDSNLLREAQKVFDQYGLTAEQAVEMFFRWVAANPEEATVYLLEGKRMMKNE